LDVLAGELDLIGGAEVTEPDFAAKIAVLSSEGHIALGVRLFTGLQLSCPQSLSSAVFLSSDRPRDPVFSGGGELILGMKQTAVFRCLP
jgi:hypothetical protein